MRKWKNTSSCEVSLVKADQNLCPSPPKHPLFDVDMDVDVDVDVDVGVV